MTDTQHTSDNIKQIKGYPLNLLIEHLPLNVTQFTAVLEQSAEPTEHDEWIISFVKTDKP